MIEVTIAGTAVVVWPGSLDVSASIGQRSTANFTVMDDAGALSFARGEQVTIADAAVGFVWTGYVDQSVAQQLGFAAPLTHDVRCVDQKYLADKRIAARSYEPPVTVGDVVTDLYTEYLAAEGVTVGSIAPGPSLEAGAVISYERVSSALDRLAAAAGEFMWDIDSDKTLTFGPRGASTAPWVADGSRVMVDSWPSITTGNADFRTVEYVVGGQDLTDPQTETFKGDGEVQSFTVGFPIGMVPTIKVDGVPKTVGIKGVDDDEAFDWYWNKGDPTVTQQRSATELTSAQVLTVVYRGLFSVIARIESPPLIDDTRQVEGGSGLVEHVTVDRAAASRDAAIASGRAQLDAYGVIGRQLRFMTESAGLAPGQSLTVDMPGLGLAGVPLLVDQVRVSDPGQGRLTWSVTAVDGPTSVPWTKILGPAEERIDDLLQIGGAVLMLVVAASERTAWLELPVSPTTEVCTPLDAVFPFGLC